MADSYCNEKTFVKKVISKNSFARAKGHICIACTGVLTTRSQLFPRLFLKIYPHLCASDLQKITCAHLWLNRIISSVLISLSVITTSEANTSYTVKKYDTLKQLAKSYLGDSSKWYVIADANPLLHNPNLLSIGTQLNIPNRERVGKTTAQPSNTQDTILLPINTNLIIPAEDISNQYGNYYIQNHPQQTTAIGNTKISIQLLTTIDK